MVIDPMDLMCNHHLTPTRGGMETVNRNLNGAEKSLRGRRPVRPREEKVVNGRQALPLAGQIEAAKLMIS
jgi:hypothetical protein